MRSSATRRRSRPTIVLPLAVVLVAGVVSTGRADTFLLADGVRVSGELEEEFTGPDEKTWLRVRTSFGSLELRKSAVQKRLGVTRRGGPLRVESILVSTLKGKVERSRDGTSWMQISPEREATTGDALPTNRPNSVVAPGDSVRTGEDGEADLDIGWGVLHLAPGSEVELCAPEDADAERTVVLRRGALGARLDDLPKESEFRVETPQSSMGVRGTTFTVRVGDETLLAVEEGEVVLGERPVGAGEAARAAADGGVAPREPDAGDRALFERLRTTYAAPRFDRALIESGTYRYPNWRQYDGVEWEPVSVTVPAFEMARHEVTNAQYREFVAWMAAHADHRFCHPDEPDDWVHGESRSTAPDAADWYPGSFRDDRQPAVGVAWFDAFAFCAWIGARLPSDTEWEWAAVSGNPKRGGKGVRLEDHFWILENAGAGDSSVALPRPVIPLGGAEARAAAAAGLTTRPVGTRDPDRNGLHDLHGNADEWVHDRADHGTGAVPRDGRPRPRSATVARYIRGTAIDQPASRISPGVRRFAAAPYPFTGFRPVFDLRRR